LIIEGQLIFYTFLLTIVATDYSFTCLLPVVVVGTDKNLNFSAVRRPIGLKLSGDLGLVSQISMHVLVSRFFILETNKRTTKTLKSRKSQNLRFLRRAESDCSETWWGHPDKY
jgi:hypothetical protein